jgi:hypothetical protein
MCHLQYVLCLEDTFMRSQSIINLRSLSALLDLAVDLSISRDVVADKADAGDKAESSRRNSLAATGDAAPSLPFGVTLLGPAWTDEYLWGIAQQFSAASGLGCGLAGHGLNASVPS